MHLNINKKLGSSLNGKVVLVTGGTGSIGSGIVRRALSLGARVRIFSRNEHNQYLFKNSLPYNLVNNARFLIGDIRDYSRLRTACDGVDYVFHCAALKHVDICEYNPFEASSININGTQNVINACLASGVDTLIGVSTDKAVNPTSTMGATKLVCERLLGDASNYRGSCRTSFGIVRFGNVVASRGSVIPNFISLIKRGSSIPITDYYAMRYFVYLDDAINMMLYALDNCEYGEIFVPKMFKATVSDIVYGLERYYKTNLVKDLIGLRSGEKLVEELFTTDELSRVSTNSYGWSIEKHATLSDICLSDIEESIPHGLDIKRIVKEVFSQWWVNS